MRSKAKDRGGSRLSQVTIVLTLSAIMASAAIVVPVLSDQTSDDDRAAATAGCNLIATALLRYTADTTFPPSGFRGQASYLWLRGPGEAPAASAAPGGWVASLSWFLTKNYMADVRWLGPYLDEVPVDPWGRQYIVLCGAWWPGQSARGTAHAWVLSAGPDGILDTTSADAELAGDDLGIEIDVRR
jgi:hypothetical protein